MGVNKIMWFFPPFLHISERLVLCPLAFCSSWKFVSLLSCPFLQGEDVSLSGRVYPMQYIGGLQVERAG